MSDIVERLRTMNIALTHEAADEIRRLRGIIELGDANSSAMYQIAASYGFGGAALGELLHRMGRRLGLAEAKLAKYRELYGDLTDDD